VPSSSVHPSEIAGSQAHVTNTLITLSMQYLHTVQRKTITIREDQEEWIQANHLNLSSFIQAKLDELIEARET
jgi:hypothetical protein